MSKRLVPHKMNANPQHCLSPAHDNIMNYPHSKVYSKNITYLQGLLFCWKSFNGNNGTEYLLLIKIYIKITGRQTPENVHVFRRFTLKVLSIDMYLTGSGVILWVFIKGEARRLLVNSARPPPPLRAIKVSQRHLFPLLAIRNTIADNA